MGKLYSIHYEVFPKNQSIPSFATFPIDMLRYDSSYPANQESVSLIQNCTSALNDTPISEPIELKHIEHGNKSWNPTFERWKSFGWIATKVQVVTL